MPPSRSALQAILERCGIRLTGEQLDRLWTYHGMLRAANPDLNLTRIHNFENMVLKHYVDSLLVLNYGDLPSPLVDMGSGPGLPGIPLKIARPEVRMILAEPRGARAEFLESVVRRLGLEGIEVYARKVGPRFPSKVAGIITRAVASIPETLDLVARALEPGGRMLFMKGPDCEAEIAEARRTHAESFRLAADHAYVIPGTPHARRLVIYERLAGDDEGPASRFTGEVREATSASNPAFRHAKELLTGKGIRKAGQALIAGARPVAEVLERFPENAVAWLTDSNGPPPTASGVIWVRLADALFKELDVSGTHRPLLQVRVPEMAEWSETDPWPEGCTLFVPLQDPENVGAVIRSAAAFGAARVVLLREAAHPFHPKAARAAGPALFQTPLLWGPSVTELRVSAVPLLPLSGDGQDVSTVTFPERFGLVPGLEGPGLPEALRALPGLRIPIAPGVESLNAATATAIALYEWRRSRTTA